MVATWPCHEYRKEHSLSVPFDDNVDDDDNVNDDLGVDDDEVDDDDNLL